MLDATRIAPKKNSEAYTDARILASVIHTEENPVTPQHQLTFTKPASDWLESLPVGNGQLGAMVFGDPITERLQITEESIWAGPPVPEVPAGAEEGIAQARKHIFEGDYPAAEKVVREKVLGPSYVPRSQQPLGDIGIQFHGRRVRTSLFAAAVGPDPRLDFSCLENYSRDLDLRLGVASSSWEWADHRESGEVFCSAVDGVMVARYRSSEPGTLSCRIDLTREAGGRVQTVGKGSLLLQGQASHRGKQLGVRFASLLGVRVVGGSCLSDSSSIEVAEADEIVLMLAAATDYSIDDPQSPRGDDLALAATQRVERAMAKGFEHVLADHLADHKELYSRVELDLGSSPTSALPLDKRRAAFKAGGADPALEALQYNFGRYLLIASSRPGTLPANLQGVWNHELAAPWNVDYHTNINVQMNYWAAESCGLGECHQSFFDFMEKLLPSARRSAQAIGCRGAFVGVSTDPWLYTSFYGEGRYGMWVMGLAWCSRHFFEHYQYGGDRDFLAKRALPLMKEASLFLVDWLVEDPATGRLVSGPSTSPENLFRAPSGEESCLSMGCAMDQEIIWDCFTNTLAAADVLGEAGVWVDEVKGALENLALPEIGGDGRLKEWAEEFEEVDPAHRHLSHLYGLHPSSQFIGDDSADITAAIEKSIAKRLEGGTGSVGWSSIWKSLFYSRLVRAEESHASLVSFVRELTVANLFGTGPVFQIDCNLGYPAAVNELLLQSHAGCIDILPALPAAWPSGSIRGLRAQGGFEVELVWKRGGLESLSLYSHAGNQAMLRCGDATLEVGLAAGESGRYLLEGGTLRCE